MTHRNRTDHHLHTITLIFYAKYNTKICYSVTFIGILLDKAAKSKIYNFFLHIMQINGLSLLIIRKLRVVWHVELKFFGQNDIKHLAQHWSLNL